MTIPELIQVMLEHDNPPSPQALIEASVHLGTRSKTFAASYIDSTGQQKWKSTGLRDRKKALRLARKWEAAERAKRRRLDPLPRKAIPGSWATLTQAEVGLLLGLTERAVRQIEKRALRKLASHPLLREIWAELCGSDLGESNTSLTAEEARALLDLARNQAELNVIKKVLRLILL